MKDRFMKNGVFSLEYDKETLRDMVLELQEKNKKQKEVIDKTAECIKKFLCSKEYIDVEGIAIANNYETILNILKEVDE